MTAVDVRIYEVGPRDGLQAEPILVATEDKLRFIEMLADAGLREIETTSLVSPKAVPQLADAEKLLAALERRPEIRYPVLVPNQRGLERAIAAGVNAICLVTAATDSYVRHNIGMSQSEEEYIRRAANRALQQITALDTIDKLTVSVEAFHTREGRYPGSWADMLRAGALTRVPVDEYSVPFAYDPVTHTVTIGPDSPLLPLLPALVGK